MSELRAGRFELVELDIDIRLCTLIDEAYRLDLISVSDAKDFVARAYWNGVEDATTDESPELLYTEHGFPFPPASHRKIPVDWAKPEYILSDEELVAGLEEAWEGKIEDSTPDDLVGYMRAAYGVGHALMCSKERGPVQ